MGSPYDLPDKLAHHLADALNTDVITMRLLLSVISGYPIACVYFLRGSNWSITCRQAYLLFCGLALYYWNFGVSIIHAFIAIFATMLVNFITPNKSISVIFAFVFNLGYLLLGSYICNRGSYDINWTMPHCILCLRLIGLTWDLYDGAKPESERSVYQKQSALMRFPEVLETFSFCFVPTAFITGPQFTMRHYQAFISNSLRPSIVTRNRSFIQRYVTNAKVHRTVVRFSMGLTGILFLSKLLSVFPADVMLTDEFQKRWNFFARLTYMAIFSQLVLLRYISVWLLGEGSSVLLGLGCTGYVHIRHRGGQSHSVPTSSDSAKIEQPGPSNKPNRIEVRQNAVLERRDSAIYWANAGPELLQLAEGYDPQEWEVREADHTACANVSLGRFLLATTTDDLVAGFNINTNKWMLEYIYKRLKFLQNKNLSQLLTLLFLAVWHGSHSGYYVNFGLEFVIVTVEKDFLAIVKRSVHRDFLYNTIPGVIICWVVGKLHVYFLLASPLVAFGLLKFHFYYPVLKSVYFVGFIYLLWPLFRPLAKKLFPPAPADTLSNSNRLRLSTQTSHSEDSASESSVSTKAKLQ